MDLAAMTGVSRAANVTSLIEREDLWQLWVFSDDGVNYCTRNTALRASVAGG